MTCECGNSKTIQVSGKTSDACVIQFGEVEKVGYIPGGLAAGRGDYIKFEFCIACGKIQKFKPLADSEVIEILEEE
jgi:hypothetical protein